MLLLGCAFVSKWGGPFHVEIDEHKTIGDLQQAIKDANANRVQCNAGDLALYLATTANNKQWVPSRDETVRLLAAGEVPLSVEAIVAYKNAPLDPTRQLAEVLDGQQLPPPTTSQLHVLVVLPVLQWRRDLGPNDVVYDLAHLTADEGEQLLTRLQVRMVHVPTLPFAGTPRAVDAFEWSTGSAPLTRERQREEFYEYFNTKLKRVLYDKDLDVLPMIKEELEWDSPLNVSVQTVDAVNVKLVGATDLLILDRRCWLPAPAQGIRLLPGVKMLIHVAMEVCHEASALFQTAAQLIALDLRTRYPVMALLTNLTDLWQFLWVGDDACTIHVATLARADEALEELRAVLKAEDRENGEEEDAEDSPGLCLPCISEGRLQLHKLTALATLVGEPSIIDIREIEWVSMLVKRALRSRPSAMAKG